jgi:hypothetical protein
VAPILRVRQRVVAALNGPGIGQVSSRVVIRSVEFALQDAVESPAKTKEHRSSTVLQR